MSTSETNRSKTMQFDRKINAPAGQAWDVVAAISGVDLWIPFIKSCRVEGRGPGARRYCETADGHALEERVLAVVNETRTFWYVVESGLPVSRYEGLMQVVPDGDGRCRMLWTVTFEGTPDANAAVETMLTQAAPALLSGLEGHLARERA